MLVDKRYTVLLICGHCLNLSKRINRKRETWNQKSEFFVLNDTVNEVVMCEVCVNML